MALYSKVASNSSHARSYHSSKVVYHSGTSAGGEGDKARATI